MSHILFVLIAAAWNILWFIVFPIFIVKYLSRFPFIGDLFEAAADFAKESILSRESMIFLAIFIIAASISNYVYTGDTSGVNKTFPDMDVFRWSFSYFVFVITTIISVTLLVYFIYKLQLFLVFFLSINLFTIGHPLASVSNLFLWYLSYLILSIAAIIFGYLLKRFITGPGSIKMRNYFCVKPKLLMLEFFAVNVLVYANIATLFFSMFPDKLSVGRYSLIDYKVIFAISMLMASFMIYIKYRYDKGDLPFNIDSGDTISDSPFF